MEVVVLVICMTWLAIGGALALIMGRRGFDAYSWFVLGTLLGPLAVAIAVYAAGTQTESKPETVR